MKKRHSNLKIRVEFEPNRFSFDYLVKVYEHLKPVDSRLVSNEPQKKGEAGNISAIKGNKK